MTCTVVLRTGLLNSILDTLDSIASKIPRASVYPAPGTSTRERSHAPYLATEVGMALNTAARASHTALDEIK